LAGYHPAVFLRSDTHAAGPPDQHPALLAKIIDDRGVITGCARTFLFLNPDTGAISDLERPKRILGQLHGNAIRFGSGPFGADLIVGEGLENTLSVGSALPEYDLAACLTANHLAVFIPPTSVRRIWIARDGGDVGAQAALRLSRRLIPEGYFCSDLVPTLGDFNDDLLRFGKEALRQSLLLAMKEQRRFEHEG
jgi:Toprim domain